MKLMSNVFRAGLVGVLLIASTALAESKVATISGKVVNAAGDGLEGVMVSAVDDEQRKWVSVFTQKDGTFKVEGLRSVDHKIRTRLMGLADEWRSVVNAGTADLVIETRKAVGEELELQRPASSAFSMLEFDNPRDKMNFKMFCTYLSSGWDAWIQDSRETSGLANDDTSNGRFWWIVSTYSANDCGPTTGYLFRRRCRQMA